MIGRVADDDDIVIDDLQADLAHLLDKEDDENGVKVNFILLKLNFKNKEILKPLLTYILSAGF